MEAVLAFVYIWFMTFLTYTIYKKDKEKKEKEEKRKNRWIEIEKQTEEWSKLIAVDKEELSLFRNRISNDYDFWHEVEEHVKAVCAEIPGMDDFVSFLEGKDAWKDRKNAFMSIVSMIYYAQFGKITCLWRNGWIYGDSLCSAFRKYPPSGKTIRLFCKWWQEELRRNGFPYPEIDFVEPFHHDEERYRGKDLVPHVIYFVDGPECPYSRKH